MTHQIGDVVRLIRGWTPMAVIGFDNDGEVIASYYNFSSQSGPCRITEEYYKRPEDFYDYIRPQNGFVVWDGKPTSMKVPPPMSLRYIMKSPPFLSGSLISHQPKLQTAILRMNDGSLSEFDVNDIREDLPYTFEVKSVSHHLYHCQYSLPDNVSRMTKGEMLLSDTGNVYIVTRVDTNQRKTKGMFEGRRIQTAPL